MPFETKAIDLKEYLKKKALKQYNSAIYELVESLLALDPNKRPNAEEILKYNILTSI
jgi:hypothetical protein